MYIRNYENYRCSLTLDALRCSTLSMCGRFCPCAGAVLARYGSVHAGASPKRCQNPNMYRNNVNISVIQ